MIDAKGQVGGMHVVTKLALAVFGGLVLLIIGGQIAEWRASPDVDQANISAERVASPLPGPQASSDAQVAAMSAGQKLVLLNEQRVATSDEEVVRSLDLAFLALCSEYKVTSAEAVEAVWGAAKVARGKGIEVDPYQLVGVAIDGFAPEDSGGMALVPVLAHYVVLRSQGYSHQHAHVAIKMGARAYR